MELSRSLAADRLSIGHTLPADLLGTPALRELLENYSPVTLVLRVFTKTVFSKNSRYNCPLTLPKTLSITLDNKLSITLEVPAKLILAVRFGTSGLEVF